MRQRSMDPPWDLFHLGPFLLSTGLPWSMADVPGEYLVEKTYFLLAKRYKLQTPSCVGMEAHVHFLLSVRRFWLEPVQALCMLPGSWEFMGWSVSWGRQCFLGDIHPLCLYNVSASPPHSTGRPEGRGLMETSPLVKLSVSKSLTLCTLSSCGSLLSPILSKRKPLSLIIFHFSFYFFNVCKCSFISLCI